MSGSDWSIRSKVIAGLYFAFCGALLVAAVYWSGRLSGYQEGRSVEASARHEAEAKQQVEEACSALTGASMVECVYDTAAAAQEAERSEQDLQAQQGMERWAFWMFSAAIAQTLVAGAALILLLKDLRQNRHSAEAQLRAYLTLSKFKEKAEKGIENVRVGIKNFGQTPAWQVQFAHRIVSTPDFTHQDLDFSKPTTADIFPTEDWVDHECPYRVREGEAVFFYLLEIRYADAFGRRWAHRYKFRKELGDIWRSVGTASYEVQIG